MYFSILSVNCRHVCIIYVKIYEKILGGGLEVSFSICYSNKCQVCFPQKLSSTQAF